MISGMIGAGLTPPPLAPTVPPPTELGVVTEEVDDDVDLVNLDILFRVIWEKLEFIEVLCYQEGQLQRESVYIPLVVIYLRNFSLQRRGSMQDHHCLTGRRLI